MTEDLKTRIYAWFDKSGYPLELFTYQTLVDNGFTTTKSPLFADLESGKAREIDMLASLFRIANTYSFTLDLVVECKKSNKPLLVLCADSSKTERLAELLGPKNVLTHRQVAFSYFKNEQMDSKEKVSVTGKFSESSFTGYSLIQAFENSDEGIFRTLQGLAKADSFCNAEHEKFFSEIHQDTSLEVVDRNPFYLTIPVLVVEAPLFNCYLGEKGNLEIVETEWTTVNLKPFWQAPQRFEEEICNIQIVSRNHLKDFVQEVKILCDYFSSEESVLPNNTT